MKEILYSALLAIVFMLGSLFNYAQPIEYYKGTYTFQGGNYKFKELGNILSQDKAAYEVYSKAQASSKRLNAFLILLGGVLLYLIGGTSGLIALFQLDNLTFQRSESIAIYNGRQKLGYKPERQTLKLGLTSYGLSLHYEF